MSDERQALTLNEAARVTGLSAEALRARLRRGTLQGFRGNDGRLRVYIEPADRAAGHPATAERPGGRPAARPVERPGELTELHTRAAVAEALAAELRQRLEELRRDLAEVKVERDRLLAMLDEALAERRERRPWPGLRAWWRRIIEGEG